MKISFAYSRPGSSHQLWVKGPYRKICSVGLWIDAIASEVQQLPYKMYFEFPAGATAIWGQFCIGIFHFGIIPSALINSWCDWLVYFLSTTPFISWKSECPSILAVLFLQNAWVTITDSKSSWSVVTSSVQCALMCALICAASLFFLYSLYKICESKWTPWALLLMTLAHHWA